MRLENDFTPWSAWFRRHPHMIDIGLTIWEFQRIVMCVRAIHVPPSETKSMLGIVRPMNDMAVQSANKIGEIWQTWRGRYT
jgi:hypothetical protein